MKAGACSCPTQGMCSPLGPQPAVLPPANGHHGSQGADEGHSQQPQACVQQFKEKACEQRAALSFRRWRGCSRPSVGRGGPCRQASLLLVLESLTHLGAEYGAH
jgi:hypothetical protein